MEQPNPIRRALGGHRNKLLLTYALFALEMLGSLLRPYLLGAAIDGLMRATTADWRRCRPCICCISLSAWFATCTEREPFRRSTPSSC